MAGVDKGWGTLACMEGYLRWLGAEPRVGCDNDRAVGAVTSVRRGDPGR